VLLLLHFLVAFISPLLSGIADCVGDKKSFMKFFYVIWSFVLHGMYWFNLENIYLGLAFYFLGLIGYWGSLVFL
jgi:UMF1 family MFS transporter